jgi:hypothetical protein
MRRSKGDLPGRFVNAYIRKWPNRHGEYLDVAAYQERMQPPPSEQQIASLQGELDLQSASTTEVVPNRQPQ